MKPKSLEPKAQQSRRAMQEPDGGLTLTSPRVMNHSPSTLNYGDIAQQTYPTLAFIANKSQFIIGHWTLSLPLVSREWKNGSNSSYTCTPFLHSLLTKGKYYRTLGPFEVPKTIIKDYLDAEGVGFGFSLSPKLESSRFRCFSSRSPDLPTSLN